MNTSFLSRLANRATTEFHRRRYHVAATAVLDTPPIRPGTANFTLLSMVQKRDVASYLVAVKSFVHYLNPSRIVVICDPSMDAQDKSTLQQHIPHIELRDASEFTHPDIPRGGCWERLLAITSYVADHYVVQLDADTISYGPLAVVQSAIEGSRGFVIGEEPAQHIYTLRETAARVSLPTVLPGGKAPHIQISAEAVMDCVGLAPDKKYVRGCAGFTGFPPNPGMQNEFFEFSAAMSKHFGERWKEWGTEQITSNFLVANCEGQTVVLPYPDYGTPDVESDKTVFLHFIGSMRFTNGRYKQLTKKVIQKLATS